MSEVPSNPQDAERSYGWPDVAEDMKDWPSDLQTHARRHLLANKIGHTSGGDTVSDDIKFGRAAKVATLIRSEGIDFRYIPFAQTDLNEAFEGLFLLMSALNSESPDESTVRLYRGVTDVDSSILAQVPDAMRGLDTTDKSAETQTLGDALDKFAAEPTYENFTRYAERMKQQGATDPESVIDRVTSVNKFIAEGDSLRIALKYMHIASMVSGNRADISPYVATTLDPSNAYTFGTGALLAYDVPVSRLAGEGESNEVLVIGRMSESWLKAIAIKKERGDRNPDYGVALSTLIPDNPHNIDASQPEWLNSIEANLREKDAALLS